MTLTACPDSSRSRITHRSSRSPNKSCSTPCRANRLLTLPWAARSRFHHCSLSNTVKRMISRSWQGPCTIICTLKSQVISWLLLKVLKQTLMRKEIAPKDCPHFRTKWTMRLNVLLNQQRWWLKLARSLRPRGFSRIRVKTHGCHLIFSCIRLMDVTFNSRTCKSCNPPPQLHHKANWPSFWSWRSRRVSHPRPFNSVCMLCARTRSRLVLAKL